MKRIGNLFICGLSVGIRSFKTEMAKFSAYFSVETRQLIAIFTMIDERSKGEL